MKGILQREARGKSGVPGRRPTSTVYLVAVAAMVIVGVIIGSFAFDQYHRHADYLADADQDTRNAAVLLAEHTARTFEGVDKTLAAVAELHREVELGVYRNKTMIQSLLKAIHGGSPMLRAVGWTDADGNRVASSLFADPPALNIADQEHFIAQRDHPGLGLYIAAPIHSKLTGDVIINVSERLETLDGRFAGIVAGVVEPSYFSAVYRSVELGPGRLAALYRSDGVILAREPNLPERLGQSVASTAWFRDLVPKSAVGTYHGVSIFDGTDRIISYARVPGAPLVVSTAMARDDALAAFRRDLYRGLARASVTVSALLVGAWLLATQLHRRQRADSQFRELLEAAPEAMVITDKHGRIALVNGQAERLFGYPRAELLGQPIEMLMPERYRASHPTLLARYAESASARPMGYGRELCGLRKDGSEFPVEISLSPLETDEGLLLSSAIHDISERRRAEADLKQARLAAEKANLAKSEFLSSMSHELRTPLNAVIGFAELLQINPKAPLAEKQREQVDHIVRGGHHLLDLVNEVLDLSGIESGRLKLSLERVNLQAALDEVRQTMAPLAAKAEIVFGVHVNGGVPDVHADRQRLRQVLINLVSNAIKYNRSRGSVSVVGMRTPEGRVRIAVADTGIGISAEHQRELFQPFQRLGAERTGIEGAGVGLALTKRLVEAMAGSIGCDSEPGKGSTFWVELPAEADLAAAVATRPISAAASPLAAAGGYSLLYVEDNPASLRLMENLVEMLPDVQMFSAPTPQLGLELAAAHRPDVIVLDLNLPGMDGFELLARLKAMPETRDTPVLALTAAAFPRDVERGVAAGFFRYLVKPLDVAAALAAIDAALKRDHAEETGALAET